MSKFLLSERWESILKSEAAGVRSAGATSRLRGGLGLQIDGDLMALQSGHAMDHECRFPFRGLFMNLGQVGVAILEGRQGAAVIALGFKMSHASLILRKMRRYVALAVGRVREGERE